MGFGSSRRTIPDSAFFLFFFSFTLQVPGLFKIVFIFYYFSFNYFMVYNVHMYVVYNVHM